MGRHDEAAIDLLPYHVWLFQYVSALESAGEGDRKQLFEIHNLAVV